MAPPEMGLSPLVGLLQSLKILLAVSLAHPLKHALKIFDEGLKCDGGEIGKNPIKKKN